MKQAIKRVIIATISVALLVPVAVSAHPGHDEGDVPVADQARHDLQETLQSKKEERTAKLETKRADLQERLNSTKKKICERHESKINDIINTMNKRRQSAFDRITKVSDAVLAYSNENSLSFVDYDAIVAKVTAAKSAAKLAMNTQQSVVTFDCDGEQPRADMSAFKEKRLDSIDAMHAYRNAVKELVAGVKEAAKAARETATEGGQ